MVTHQRKKKAERAGDSDCEPSWSSYGYLYKSVRSGVSPLTLFLLDKATRVDMFAKTKLFQSQTLKKTDAISIEYYSGL